MNTELIQTLQQLVDDNPKSYTNLLKGMTELYSFVNQYPGEKLSEKCFNALNGIRDNTRHCKHCGNVIESPFINVTKGYKSFCSIKCSVSTPEALAKKQATNLAKYGVDNPAKAKSVQEKAKQTILEKYGVEYVNQVKEFQEKGIQTNLKKYGTRIGSQSEQVKEKMRETNQTKYGVDYILQSEDFKDIQRKNNFEKYGVEHTFQVKEFQDKSKETIQGLYGVDNPMQAEQVQYKAKQTNLERYGVEYPTQNPDIQSSVKGAFIDKYGVEHPMKTAYHRQLSSEKQRNQFIGNGGLEKQVKRIESIFGVECLTPYNEYTKNNIFKWKHLCCGTEYTSHFGSDITGKRILVCPNIECRNQSTPQRAVYEYIRELIGEKEILVNDRKVITPYELDIYIPSKRLAIEMDGVYWHQDEKSSLDKVKLCKEQGIQLLHITDLSWYEHTEVWKSIISSKIKTQHKIFARKCEVKMIDNKVCSEFLGYNHLQGGVYGSVNMGLYHESELVAVMNFGVPRFNKDYQWELLRYSSKLNVTIVGGASKLLSHFKKNNSGSIITYAKKEYSGGGLYKTLGFDLIDEGTKSYFYIHRSTNKVVSRYQAQKHKLPDLLGSEFDINLTEKQNMLKAGYFLVNDRGSYTFGMK